MDGKLIFSLAEAHGDAFYLLDSARFADNFDGLLSAFRAIYPSSFIAYSYKTNYIPALCRLVQDKGGFAEVVSSMEHQLAAQIGVPSGNIYYNGPYKTEKSLCGALLEGVRVNLDSLAEVTATIALARENPKRVIAVGLRCNFGIGAGISRFGLDAEGEEFAIVLSMIAGEPNLRLSGLHCHFPFRSLESFKARARGMTAVLSRVPQDGLCYVGFGGGYFGGVSPEFAQRLKIKAPDYADYAAVVAGAMRELFGAVGGPALIIEPGSALVADAMSLAARVVALKSVRGRHIAVLAASLYNINPSAKGVPRPVQVVHRNQTPLSFKTWDLTGYTCIEDDCLYAGYEGSLAEGDFVLFHNVGSYSVVFKPPFILPNVPVVDISDVEAKVVKRAETFDDIFATYNLEL